MKTKQELIVFAEGYLESLIANGGAPAYVDDWVKLDEYELNIFGSYYSVRLNDDTQALSVDVYPRDWVDVLPDPLHSFDIKGATA